MSELDFLIPKQIHVGLGAFGDGHVVDVTVLGEPESTDLVVRLSHGQTMLGSVRCRGDEQSVYYALAALASEVGRKLDRELLRKKNLTG